MKPNTASKTAQYVALFRAVETMRPKSKRLFTDPYAIHFLDKRYQRVIKSLTVPLLRKVILNAIQRKGLSLSSIIGRTKFIDDSLFQTIQEGTQQVIILGAGFDTRSIRLDFLKNIRVIEIDHPDTAHVKLEILKKVITVLPDNVHYYQVDLNNRSLLDVAAKSQINFSLPTTLIWEGVTNYLTREVIDTTFDFTRQFTNRFTMIFTYIDHELLKNPSKYAGVEQLFKTLQQSEERWLTGFNPELMRDYLSQFDLTLKKDLTASEYCHRYMPDRKYFSKGYELYHTAIAIRGDSKSVKK